MNRRRFLQSAAALPGYATLKSLSTRPARQSTVHREPLLAASGYTLKQLAALYEQDLFDDFLPFMEKYVIDHQYGGFMCAVDRDGKRINSDKTAWFEGRGIWVYSFLYRNLAPERKYLEVAEKSVKFILQHRPTGDALWPRFFTRTGRPKGAQAEQIYGDLFIAEGLAQYAMATGTAQYWRLAREIVLKCMRIYNRPDYYPAIGKTYLGKNAPPFPGARILGVWMVFLRVVTQMLEFQRDADLEAVAQTCIDAVRRHHFNPEFGLINELIQHDFSRPTNEYAQLVYTGHAIEILWMLLYEAMRKRDRTLWDWAGDQFMRHVEVAWDDVYGGVFRNLLHVDANQWTVDKALWAQEEVLVGSLYMVEHSGDEKAGALFGRMYKYVRKHFPLAPYGFPLWILYADRKVTFQRHTNRVGNYHHPRHLMLNLLSLRRMMQRNGRPSNLLFTKPVEREK